MSKKSQIAARQPKTDPNLIIVKDVKGNPRKEGTFGHASFSLIRSGITVHKFVELGGRMTDLRWDINHGNCHLEVKK